MWHDKKSESPSKITQGLTFQLFDEGNCSAKQYNKNNKRYFMHHKERVMCKKYLHSQIFPYAFTCFFILLRPQRI